MDRPQNVARAGRRKQGREAEPCANTLHASPTKGVAKGFKAIRFAPRAVSATFRFLEGNGFSPMNIELTHKALAKVGNPHVLVNLVSRRVRQLNSGGSSGRPLLEPGLMPASDIALTEIAEEKLGWQFPDADPAETQTEIPGKRRRAKRVAAES